MGWRVCQSWHSPKIFVWQMKWIKLIKLIYNDLQVAHPHSGSSSTWLIPGRIGIWKCWFLRRGENWSTRRKTSRNKGENSNQQQTQTTYGVDAGIEPGPHWWKTSALTTAPPLLCTNRLVYVWQTTKRWVDTTKADLPTNDKGKLGDSWQKKTGHSTKSMWNSIFSWSRFGERGA